MHRTSQTALDRYKAKRQLPGAPQASARVRNSVVSTRGRLVWLLILTAVLSVTSWHAIPRRPEPVNLTYEIDLASAPQGALVITLVVEGKLPRSLDLEFPPGVFGDQSNGVTAHAPTAHALGPDGEPGHPLTVDKTDDGWRMGTAGTNRAGFIYRVDLTRAAGHQQDIRSHISTPVCGGVRAAGFELFLEPVNVPTGDLTVAIHNPDELPVLVPWPALVRSHDNLERSAAREVPQGAHLGLGQGFAPQPGIPPAASAAGTGQTERARPVPANLLFHPRDLADLNNALLICGDIRIASAQARDCVIQYATDRDWLFENADALDLVRRIARAEIGFFGSSPTPQITVLLAANEITASEGFDIYGVHTGSSVLVLLAPETTWGMLEEEAASVIAHEMFHGWLGEAIKQSDPATLWFTEGATTWYAARMLTASGVWDPDHSREILGARLQRDYAGSPLLGRLSVAAAAAEVMADGQQVRFAYAGGVAACMALDQRLSELTGHRHPLDEVLRHLYNEAGDSPLSRESLEAAVLQVTGVDCSDWLEAHVYGKSALPPIDRLI